MITSLLSSRKRVPRNPAEAWQAPSDTHLLLAACLGDEPMAALRRIRDQRLWEYLATEACDMGLGGVLLEQWDEWGVDVPVSAQRQLDVYRQHVAAANADQQRSAADVCRALCEADIPFLVLKGAALNATVYTQPGLRAMTDIDLLIQPGDVQRADKALREAGCTPGPDLIRENFYPRFYHERAYFTPRPPALKIDLHCRPFHMLRYARTMPADALWDHARTISFAGMPVRMPSPVNMLIHLAVHAAGHGCSELRWLYDIKRWLDRFGDEIAIDDLAERCRRWRLALPVHRALRATRHAFEPRVALARRTDKRSRLTEALAATDQQATPLDHLALAAAPLAGRAPVLCNLANLISLSGICSRASYLNAMLLPDARHLGQLYAGRHRGWQAVAHAVRIGRCVSRLVRPAAAETVT